jgi:hypothetical protein
MVPPLPWSGHLQRNTQLPSIFIRNMQMHGVSDAVALTGKDLAPIPQSKVYPQPQQVVSFRSSRKLLLIGRYGLRQPEAYPT